MYAELFSPWLTAKQGTWVQSYASLSIFCNYYFFKFTRIMNNSFKMCTISNRTSVKRSFLITNSKPWCRSEQESIPVGCVPPACQPYILRWLPDVSTNMEGGSVHGSNVSWVMVTRGPPKQNDRHDWKYYLRLLTSLSVAFLKEHPKRTLHSIYNFRNTLKSTRSRSPQSSKAS